MKHDCDFADRLLRLALEAFESQAGVERWLTAPQLGLCGNIPIIYANTEKRCREVECLLRRIDFGIPP